MSDLYGSDFISITDEDGNEYELEVLSTIEHNGCTYLAVIPAGDVVEDLQVSILKVIEEDGEEILATIEDDDELDSIHQLIMEQLYEKDDE